MQGADGNLYGTTQTGGTSDGYGTVFEVEPGGGFFVIRRFTVRNDGVNPVAGLVQGRDGALYGSTTGGAAATIFRLQLSAVAPGTVNLEAAHGGRVQYGTGKGAVVFRRTGGDIGLPLTVAYTVQGSAVPGEDFKPLSGTVTIPAGASQAKVKITPLPNTANTGKRKLKITLTPPLNGSYGTGAPNSAKLNVVGSG